MNKYNNRTQGLARRGEFLRRVAAAGTGLALAGAAPLTALAATGTEQTTAAGCGESVQTLINTALIAEQLATTFYYTGLTTRSIVGNRRVAGASANPNAVSANGDPGNVAYLQAALDQEQKHARILANVGAVSPLTHFYFPASTFETLGFTNHSNTYLWVLDHLETAFIGAYTAAARRFAELGRIDLATVSLRILAVECQHRALYRVISADDPADNVTLEVTQFGCLSDAADALQPFITGKGFSGGVSPAVPIPTIDQLTRIIGKNTSS